VYVNVRPIVTTLLTLLNSSNICYFVIIVLEL